MNCYGNDVYQQKKDFHLLTHYLLRGIDCHSQSFVVLGIVVTDTV